MTIQLQLSSLSPPEYRAYTSHLTTLHQLQAKIGGVKSSTSSASIDKDVLRRFLLEQLKASQSGVDDVLNRLGRSSPQFSDGEVLAVFRLVSHAQKLSSSSLHSHRPVDFELLLVPADPVVTPDASPSANAEPLLAAATNSMGKGNQLATNPFMGATSKRTGDFQSTNRLPSTSQSHYTPSTSSESSSSRNRQTQSNNPFRQRIVSQPHQLLAEESSPGPICGKPPLPPRRASVPLGRPSLPPRKPQANESAEKTSKPTSLAPPSSLMQQSLLAAERAREGASRDSVTLHVIRRSSDAAPTDGSRQHSRSSSLPSSRNSSTPSDGIKLSSLNKEDLVASVAKAVRESELDTTQPPPKRQVSKRSKPKTSSRLQEFVKENSGTRVWDCTDILGGNSTHRDYAMVILNQPITRKDTFTRAWKSSDLRLCADGGANRLYDLWNTDQRISYLPLMIKGDLDSIRPDVQSFYSLRGVSVKHDGSEYSTDLMKCVSEIETMEAATGREYALLLMGGLSGRVDQTVHTMSFLHKLRKTRSRSFVLSGESLAWVLDSGSHAIHIDHTTMGQTCGILPVGVDKAFVRTQGLKWNLDWETSLDGAVSSSNHLLPEEPVVYITTDKPIMWCVEIKPNLPPASPQRQSVSSTGELSRSMRELGQGVFKAAEGLGKELEKLRSARERTAANHSDNDERDELLEDRAWERLE